MRAFDEQISDVAPTAGFRERLWDGVVAAWGAVVGALPHVLHHGGPLAGAAIVSGVTGRLVFGIAGIALTIPLLLRIRRRTGGWRAPSIALGVFVVLYLVSTLVIGPALTDRRSSQTAERVPPTSTERAHEEHHTR